MYSVVILSANSDNLLRCLKSVVEREPQLPRQNIIVVDDGAHANLNIRGIRWVEGIKPFVFSRNANLGIIAANNDVILLNDDAQLVSQLGFTRLAQVAAERGNQGIYSAAIRGYVGNDRQHPMFSNFVRFESRMLAFVCVYIPKAVFQRVGNLDETLVGYGFDDDDYCSRTLDAGFELGILDNCVVDHGIDSKSTYRSKRDFQTLYDQNAGIYAAKRQRLRTAAASCAGALRIHNEALYIQEVIASLLPLCDVIHILDDHSTDNTVELCRAFGDRVVVYESPFQGLDEARDKNYLLRKIAEANPEWVLWIDGDEVLERSGPDKLHAAMLSGRSEVYSLKIAYLWNDPKQVRLDGIWGRFWRPSLFRLRGKTNIHFPETSAGGNFHCGNIPQGLGGDPVNVDVRLKHYGYLDPKQRQAKYLWYNAKDPNNEGEDRYRHIAEIPGARHAPGPAVYERWRE